MKQICFETIDSTNTYLKNNYQELENLTFVSSKIQTKGRGRNNRTWLSNDNNLLFSLLLKDKNYFDKYKSISIISAYAIITVLKEYGLNNLSIKWPNDIYVDDNKICGILLEAVSKCELECLIIGVGLNVNQKEFNGEYLVKPSSMGLLLNKDIDLNKLKEKVYDRLVNYLNLIGSYDFYQEIIKYDYLKNKDVYAYINNKKQLVKVIGINKDYSLKIKLKDEELNIETGEISFHV